MITSNLIREVCKEKEISEIALTSRIGQILQNFDKKLKHEMVFTGDLILITDEIRVTFEQLYTLRMNKK